MRVRVLRIFLLWSILTALAGCGLAKPYPALHIPEKQFREQIKTICIQKLRFGGAPDEMQDRMAAFQSLLASRLQELGFTVVSEERSETVWREVAEAESGSFDPDTGRRDNAKYEAIRSQVLSAMRAQMGCDAILFPTISLVSTSFVGGVAEWDGVVHDLGGSASGYVPALSLWVRMLDMKGEEIYFRAGGIQALSTIDSGFWKDSFEFVDDHELLADAARNRAAIAACLEPIDPSPKKEEPIHPAMRQRVKHGPVQ